MPTDQWWIFDPDKQHQLIEQAKAMTGSRLCAMCYARDVDQERYREGKGDMRGRHWTIEPVN
jgi:hypothetical protein